MATLEGPVVPVPLEWLLQRPDLQLELLAGDPHGVDVTWAHGIELTDPSPWLAGGELVLTTGLRLSRKRSEQAAYVDRLVAQGAAALGFGTGIRFDAVPRGLAERCGQTGLPLVEVPLPTPFVAIAQAVAERLADDRGRSLQRALRLQQSLTGLTLRQGLGSLVSRLAVELRGQVVVVDPAGAPVAGSPGSARLVEAVRQQLLEDPPGTKQLVVRPPGTDVELHSLTGRSLRRGWLAVQPPGPLAGESRIALNHAVSVATLHLDLPSEVEESRARVGATVLALLLERALEAGAAADHLRRFGFPDDEDVVAIVVRAGDSAAPRRRSGGATAGSTGHPGESGTLGSLALGPILDAAGVVSLVGRVRGSLVVVVPASDAPSAVDRLARAVAEAAPPQTVVGVGPAGPVSQLRQLADSAHRCARAAAQAGQSVGWSQSYPLEVLLAGEAVRQRVADLMMSSLEPLLRDPAAREQDLLATLAAYLEHNGAWETTSRALGIHRHTLRHRIAKIETLTGLPLDVAQNRVVLMLALATHAP